MTTRSAVATVHLRKVLIFLLLLLSSLALTALPAQA